VLKGRRGDANAIDAIRAAALEGKGGRMKKALLAAGLSPEFWSGIKRGRLHIPEAVIRPFIEEALADDESAEMGHCTFKDEGITLAIRVKKAGSRITLPLTVTVDKVFVNCEVQKLEAGFAWDKPMGDNLLGRLAAAVAKGLIFKMAAGRMAGNPDARVLETSRGGGRVMVDLGGLKPIRKLCRKLPVINTSVLDFVTVQGAQHVANGVELKLRRGGQR
jgi:hypothetical protein